MLVSLLLPKQYTGTVTIMRPRETSSLISALSSELNSLSDVSGMVGGGLGLKNPNDQFVGLLKSRTVEDAMIEHFQLMKEYRAKRLSDARKRFEQRATVDGDEKDGLIRISVVANSPERAAELANGYVDQFRSLSEHLAISEASQRRLFFEGQLDESRKNLAQAEDALKETEQKTGVIQIDSQSRALIESAAALRAEIAAREVQIQGMQLYATNVNPQMVTAETELNRLRSQLASLGGSGSSDELLVPKGAVPEAGLEYARRLRDVKFNETMFEILARQFEVAKLDEARQGALIQVVDPAVPPDKKTSPRRFLICIGAAGAGFLLGIFGAITFAVLEYFGNDPEGLQVIAPLKEAMK